MPHVDEGTLHAYLDGELSPAERAAADDHLAQCPECMARLGEERALIERATAVLDSARPLEHPAPPLRAQRRASGVRMPLAWAATVVLALGIGYYLHEPSESHAPSGSATASPQAAAAPTLQRRPGDVASAAPPLTAKAQDRLQRKPGADTAVIVATQPASPHETRAPTPTELREAAPRAARVDEPTAPSVSGGVMAQGAFRDTALATLRGRLVTSQWTVISKGSARTLLGTDPVGIPGLAARAIRRNPSDAGTVVVEQQLDSATVIQLYQRAATLETAGKAIYGARAGERLARFVGALRVEIAGPLTADSLNRLLDQVKPLP